MDNALHKLMNMIQKTARQVLATPHPRLTKTIIGGSNMAAKVLPTPEVLRQLLRYDAETGNLIWLPRGVEWFGSGTRSASWVMASWNAKHAGAEAFTSLGADGYLHGRAKSACLSAHRVCWALYNGVWPSIIDHINGLRTDNRLINLREVSYRENAQNRKARVGASALKGVSWNSRSGKWIAMIKHNGVRTMIGSFNNEIDAAVAYDAVAAVAFGNFARLNFGDSP